MKQSKVEDMSSENPPDESEEIADNPERIENGDGHTEGDRRGRKWTFEEEEEVIWKVENGWSWDRIAKAHSRTVRAVQIRFAMALEHPESLKVVRRSETGEPHRNPFFEPNMDSGAKGPMTRYDVIDQHGVKWFSFHRTV